MNHLDLFSGIGGFSLAARWAEIDTIQFVERDSFCQKVLAKNFPNVPIHDDIKTFNANHLKVKVDILTGGFPCQPFSVAGKKKGFSDDRYLWPEMFRIIKECQPTWIVAENVPGIIPMLDPILEDLEREGYAWQTYLIPASAVGAPHKRERLWIIANLDSKRCDIRCDNRKKRYIQDDWKQHIAKIQSEWPQFFPESWTTFNAQKWLGFITDSDSECSNERTAHNEASTERPEWTYFTSKIISFDTKFNWEENKPPISGMDDGLPKGLDRNKSLGNAIVPQIAYIFMSLIKNIKKEAKE